MKIIILISITFFLPLSYSFGQGACTNMKVESPVVAKPSDGSVVSATATSLVLGWKGSSDENYVASILFKDAVEPTTINTISSPGVRGSGNYYTAGFPVTPGMVVNWRVQAIKTLDGRTFYSYPLRSTEEYTIPDRVSPTAGATERSTISTSNSLPTATEVKVELYPNPVHTILNLNVSSMVKNANTNRGLIRVIGVDGKTVLTQKAAFGSVQVNVSRLINGIYFIRIEDAGSKLLYIAKFIKE